MFFNIDKLNQEYETVPEYLNQADVDHAKSLISTGKVDEAADFIANIIMVGMYGKQVRGSLALWTKLVGDSTQNNYQIAKDSATKVDNIGDRFDDQIAGSTNDNETIDFRHSDMLQSSFKTMRKRGDFWDEELQARALNVKWFGAVGDGVTDDTQSIQAAIDYFADSSFTTILFEGTFLLSKTENDGDGRGYAVKVDGLTRKNFDFTRANFVTPAKDEVPSLFAFYRSQNIKIKGGYAEANISKLATKRQFYTGAFIYSEKCENINISDASAKNMSYLACLFHTNYGSVRYSKFEQTQSESERELRPVSAVLLYGSSHISVAYNDITGGLQDGDISIFGADSIYDSVFGNHLRGLNWEEAITVDGGAVRTLVSGNTVEGGYKYAVDVKYNSQHTMVTNNMIDKCVIGVSVRGGEIGDAPVFNPIIEGNTVIFGGIPADIGWNGMSQTGINVTNSYNLKCSNNHLSLGLENTDYVIWGMRILPRKSTTYDYFTPFDISGNYIELQNGLGDVYHAAGDGSVGLILDSIIKANVNSNTFKCQKEGLLAVEILNDNRTIKFQGNIFQTLNVTPIQYYGSAGAHKLIITPDNVTDSNAITNAYMWQTASDPQHASFAIAQRKLSDNVKNQIIALSSDVNRTLLISIKMIADSAGALSVSSTYEISLDKKNPLFKVIDENNIDITLSVGIADGKVVIFAQSKRAVSLDNIRYKVDVYGGSLNNVNFN